MGFYVWTVEPDCQMMWEHFQLLQFRKGMICSYSGFIELLKKEESLLPFFDSVVCVDASSKYVAEVGAQIGILL